MPAKQIPLQFSRFDRIRLKDFVSPGDLQAVSAVQKLLNAEEPLAVFLWGRSGSGKSHLLQAACEELSATGQQAAYLPMKELKGLSTEILDGLEQLDLVCVDDLQAICGEPAWEQALFHLYNRLRDRNVRLLMSADTAPAGLEIKLSDLKSRLSWGLVIQLQALSDRDMIRALQQRAEQRGFSLNQDVGEYLMRRCPRDMKSLFAILDQIDEESLASQCRVTIPFVKKIISQQTGHDTFKID